MKKIVIFDMDGTLVDSKKDITISINYVRQKNHNLPPLDEEFVVEAINMEVRNLPKLFYDTECYEMQDKTLFEEHYAKQCVQNPYLYKGVVEMLDALERAGVKMGVATNAPTRFANLMLDSLGVKEKFGIIVGADRVSHSKPNPEMLLKILDFFHYDASQDRAWMVGDNSKDILSAQNAKIEALFVTWGFSPRSEFEKRIATPEELLRVVL